VTNYLIRLPITKNLLLREKSMLPILFGDVSLVEFENSKNVSFYVL